MKIAAQLEQRGQLAAAAAIYETLIGRDAATSQSFLRLAELYTELDRGDQRERVVQLGKEWAERRGDTDAASLLEQVAAAARSHQTPGS